MLLQFHTAVRHTFSLFLQLGAGGPRVRRPQEDVTGAVANATPGAGTEAQTPGRPERYFAVQWRGCTENTDIYKRIVYM